MPGSIQRRGKGRFSVVVDAGVDPVTGKRRQVRRTVRGTKKDAEVVRTKLLHQRDQGVDIAGPKATTGEYLDGWMRDYAVPNLAPKTSRRYGELVRLHLSPAIGAVKLTKLRPAHIQAAYKAMAEKGLAPRTVVHAHRILRQALRRAVDWELISRNPTDAVRPPRAPRYEIPSFSVEDVKAIMEAAGSSAYGAIIQTAILTGLRQGELMGLRWKDTDLDDRRLQVRQVSQYLSGRGFFFRPPKTRGSARPIRLSAAAVEILRAHRVQQAERRLSVAFLYEDSGLVFAGPTGKPIPPGTLHDAWKRIAQAAGVSLRFHDLRHIYASLLLVEGVHPKVVSEHLGHSAVAITLDTYTHVLPSLHQDAADAIDRILGLDVTKP